MAATILQPDRKMGDLPGATAGGRAGGPGRQLAVSGRERQLRFYNQKMSDLPGRRLAAGC